MSVRHSPASIQARRNLERLLAQFDAAQMKCSVCDLVREPLAGEDDRIAFTPTLVKRFPEPRMWVLGNLRETEIIGDLLRVCGVDAKDMSALKKLRNGRPRPRHPDAWAAFPKDARR